MKRLLIAGIDPGTTLAYALLDINGEVIKINSTKQHNLSSLILDIIKIGKVIVVGTDVKDVPYLIKNFANKVGAKIVSPKEDLKIEEKIRLTKNYRMLNKHERDALASAIMSFKRVRPLFIKIDK